MKGKTKFLIGIAIGGMLGVLFAPGKGRKTRKKIAKASKRLKDKFDRKKEQYNEEITVQPIVVVEEKVN